jgi:hypothetical protein
MTTSNRHFITWIKKFKRSSHVQNEEDMSSTPLFSMRSIIIGAVTASVTLYLIIDRLSPQDEAGRPDQCTWLGQYFNQANFYLFKYDIST